MEELAPLWPVQRESRLGHRRGHARLRAEGAGRSGSSPVCRDRGTWPREKAGQSAVKSSGCFLSTPPHRRPMDLSRGGRQHGYRQAGVEAPFPRRHPGGIRAGDLRRHSLCVQQQRQGVRLDATTGKPAWKRPFATRPGYCGLVADTNSGIVYVGSVDHKVYALRSNGRQYWPHPFTTGGMIRSSPTMSSGTVYVGSGDGKVYALDAFTGQLVWASQWDGCPSGSKSPAR